MDTKYKLDDIVWITAFDSYPLECKVVAVRTVHTNKGLTISYDVLKKGCLIDDPAVDRYLYIKVLEHKIFISEAVALNDK